MKFWLPTLVMLALITGCQKGGSAETPDASKDELPAAHASDLIDLKVGTQWVYELEGTARTPDGDQDTSGEFTMKVEEADEKGAEIQTTVKGGEETQLRRMMWLLGDDGLVQVADNDLKDKFEPPMPLLPSVLVPGKKIGWEGEGPRLDGTVGPSDMVVTVIGEEEVDTPMGRMKAWSVESAVVWVEKEEKFQARTTSWWSPKVGLVRMIRELDTPQYGLKSVLRLKSHTVKE